MLVAYTVQKESTLISISLALISTSCQAIVSYLVPWQYTKNYHYFVALLDFMNYW